MVAEGAASWAGAGYDLDTGVVEHPLTLGCCAVPDEADVGAAGYCRRTAKGGGVAFRMHVDLGVADLYGECGKVRLRATRLRR